MPEDSPEHRAFLHTVLGVTLGQYRLQRRDCLARGRCAPPVVVKSWEQMLRTVAATPGGVGYYRHWKVEWDESTDLVGVVRVRMLR
jgi:hypothetical protein